VQHALRAYTPRDQKAVKVAADTFRANPSFSTGEVITQLAVGEALVSVLEDGGVPSIVQRTFIKPPSSRVGPLTADERRALISSSPVGAAYDTLIDRESAYEVLGHKAVQRSAPATPAPPSSQSPWQQQPAPPSEYQPEPPPASAPQRRPGPPPARQGSGPPPQRSRASNRESVTEAVVKSVARNVSGQLTRSLVRGILGSLTKGLR
jgi:hypothetical protein